MKNTYLIILFFTITTNAQLRTITGVVSDDLGPLADTLVKIKGTDNGTVTDFDGKYSIQVKIGDVLEFSFVGFSTKEVKITELKNYNIVMDYGYYTKIIYQKNKKNLLTLNYYSGIKHTPKGFLIAVDFPRIIKPINPELIFAYQFDNNKNDKIDIELRFAYLFRVFRKSIDVNFLYNKTEIENFNFESYLIENLFSQRIFRQNFDIYIGVGKSTLNKNIEKTGYEIGISKRLFRYFTLHNKTIYWSKDFQFKNGLIAYYKNFNLKIEHVTYKKYNELNVGLGYVFRF